MRIELSQNEITHILVLMYENRENNAYFGNKDFWEIRTKRIIKKLEEAEEKKESEE